MKKPAIGQIVHFRQGGICFAAVIVWVWSDACVNLYVPPTGTTEPVAGALNASRNAMSVPYEPGVHGRDWSWHYAE